MAQCEVDQILPFDGVPGDGFGKSVAIDGNVAIIGTAQIDEIPRPGTAYIYRFDGAKWNPEAKLQPEDVGDSDSFGSVVSIHGDVAVVSSHLDDDLGEDSGSVYIFRFNGQEWIEDGHLLAPDGVAGDHFGAAVDIYGDYIAIGAPKVSTVLDRAGAFYLFHYSDQGWGLIRKFDSPDSTSRIQFGITLAIDDHHLVVGCRGTILPGSWKGKAFVYQRFEDLWIHTSQLQPLDLHSNANFGATVDIDDDTMAISSPIMRAIYIFTLENNTWVERQKVEQPELSIRNKEFRNISLKDDLLVSVGLEQFYEGKPFNLFAFLYRRDPAQSLETPWVFDRVLLPSNPLASPTDAVATNGAIILAGNQDNFLDDPRAGTVYVFPGVIEMEDCTSNLVNDACEIFTGLSQDCNSNGIPDECEFDCNGNYIPDECEIAAGTAFDGNNNGLLDECECPARFPIHPEDPNDELELFYSLDISKDVAIVGSPRSHGHEQFSGAALIYRRINGVWLMETKLVASDGKSYDEFGYEVAIDGNTAAVSIDSFNDRQGAVYIFQYQEDNGRWVESNIIRQPSISRFGVDVSLSKNRLAIQHGWGAGPSGIVVSIYKYIEDDNAWEIEDSMTMSNRWEVWFPQSNLELQGDLLIGGSAGSGSYADGSITIYRRHERSDGTSQWRIEAKLISPGSEFSDFYGLSAAIENDIAVVGAFRTVNNKIKTGAAYVYEYDGESWQYTKKLLPDNLDRRNSFGTTTSINRGTIMIGAQGDGRHGSLYRFQRVRNADLTTSWKSITKVHFYDAERYEYVGRKMESDGDFAIIGSIISRPPSSAWHSGIHIVDGIHDTDLDGFSDLCDSCPETPSPDLSDADGDGLGDACDVFADINNDGLINVTDLLLLLAAWGVCPDDGLLCLADLNGNGMVNTSDLLLLLQAW